MRLPLRLLAVAGLAVVLAGCEDFDFGPSDRYKEDFHFNYPLSTGGKVSVENFNGSIDIAGWEQNTVEIDGTKYASSEAVLNDIKIDVTAAPDAVRIRTVQPIGIHSSMGARYSIRVPRGATLERVSSSNGSLHVDDIQASAQLRTSNGSIRATRINGDLDARTSNGSIEAREGSGARYLHTSNGRIDAEAGKGVVEAGTSNGSIHVLLTQPDPDHAVRLESSNGSVDLTMDAAREVRATTSNSSITIHMPADSNAHLKAHTSNSSISSDFDVNVHGGELSKHRLEGDIGKGGPLVDLATSNGSIKILKR